MVQSRQQVSFPPEIGGFLLVKVGVVLVGRDFSNKSKLNPTLGFELLMVLRLQVEKKKP